MFYYLHNLDIFTDNLYFHASERNDMIEMNTFEQKSLQPLRTPDTHHEISVDSVTNSLWIKTSR